MKAADGELSGRQEVEEVVPQATQEANALRDRRQATTDATTSDEGGDNGPPAKSASADEWKTWAVESGKLTEEEAEKTTKTALVEEYGS